MEGAALTAVRCPMEVESVNALFATLVDCLLASAALLAAPRLLGGVSIRGWKTALQVSVVYAVLTGIGGWVLRMTLLPLFFLLPGIGQLLSFVVVAIPALYLTELFVDGFEVDSVRVAARAAVLIAVVRLAFWAVC